MGKNGREHNVSIGDSSSSKIVTVNDFIESATQPEDDNGIEKAKYIDQQNNDYSATAQTKTKLSDYFKIFTYTTSRDKLFLAVAIFSDIAAGVTLPLMNIVFGKLVGNFIEYFQPDTAINEQEFLNDLSTQTLYIVYLFIAKSILSYASRLGFRVVGLSMSANLRLEYLSAVFKLPISTLDTLPSGQVSNTITTNANILQQGISDKLGSLIQVISLLFSAIGVAFTFSWSLTLVTSSVLIFIIFCHWVFMPIIVKRRAEADFADEKASSIAGEVLGSIRMIVACGAEERIAGRYSGWVEESRRRGLKISPYIGGQYAPLFFSAYAALALTFWYGFKLYLRHDINSVGTIVIVLRSVMMINMAVGQTATPLAAVSRAAYAAADFFSIIDAPKPSTIGLKEPEVSAYDKIRFDSIDFAYPSRPHVKVLDGLSIDFEPGTITAIVGASGSGKSTIVGLLERWYELTDRNHVVFPGNPSKETTHEHGTIQEAAPKCPVTLRGSISIGDTNLASVDLEWWRSQVGLVQQEPFLFNDTIANNIEYGLLGSQWENADVETKRKLVEEACKEAFADEFISKLPWGYESQVGDAGVKLSGGQRQRLAIARSIIKRPKILILDEATSSIDVRGERIVQAALDKVSEGRTTIVIAHRLSTIKKANKIVVLGKGRIIEEGTHESLLLNLNGAYYALVNAQQLSLNGIDLENSEKIEESSLDIQMPEANFNNELPPLTEVSPPPKLRGFFNSFGFLLFEQKDYWPWYTLVLIGCLGSGTALPVSSWLFAQIVSVIQYTGHKLSEASDYWSLRFFILAIGVGVAHYVVGFSCNTVAVHITCTYREEYFRGILYKPIDFFDAEENSSGSLTARLANDPTQLQQLLGVNMALVLEPIFSLLGCIIIGFAHGWKLTLLTTLVALPIIIFSSYFRLGFELRFEQLNASVFAESSKFASEAIGAFRTVTSLTMENAICQRYEILLHDQAKKAFDKAKYSTLVFALSDGLPLACMALCFYYGGRLLSTHEYTAFNFFVVYMAVIGGAQNAGEFLSYAPNFAQAIAAANRILSLRLSEAEVAKTPFKLQDTDAGVKIELRDLWFKYPTRDVPIFSDLNMTIEKGQFAALVGPSGCGKTSIISLLERFYDIPRGKILCNDIDISKIDIKDYRRTISLVAQEPTLYQGTIKDNILLGVSGLTDQENLYQACKEAEIHDFIMSLPDGYSTEVGSKGINLSGGQKQRIAIARALVREPRILLLDEATSSLDSESEKLVQQAFERAGRRGMTMIVVAHRLATVQKADVIFVLDDGKVLEQGDHNSLLRQKGIYHQMALDR